MSRSSGTSGEPASWSIAFTVSVLAMQGLQVTRRWSTTTRVLVRGRAAAVNPPDWAGVAGAALAGLAPQSVGKLVPGVVEHRSPAAAR